MRVLLIEICALIAFVQIGGEFIKNELEGTPRDVLPPQNGTDAVNCCIVREIIRRIEALLQKQLERGELTINAALKPEETVPRVRNVRQSDDMFSFNKCVLKSEMEQHKNVETEHIFAIKQELEHLKELIRLLRDQQQILNMLTDVENKAKGEDEEDQRKLIKLFRMLQNNLPREAKSTSAPLPSSTPDMNQIIIEIRKLHQQIENANRIAEDKLKVEVAKQQSHLQQLQNDIENLKKGQALFVHLDPKPDANNQSDIVGATLPKAPLSKFLEKLKPKSAERKSEGLHEIKLPKLAHTPKVRAGTDDFFENLQRILDSDAPPETKETPLEFDLGPNSGLENRLLELEKQMKLSSKIQKLEKKIQQLHDTNAESKNLDDDDDDLKAQMKKLQRQLKNINKSKVESKELEEDDILDELKSLQSAINELRPKEDTSQAKIGSADIQVMLNKLIGVPAVRPVVPVVPAHSQLTPAQIQILRRVMAMKAASSHGHHAAHGPSGLGGGPSSGGLAYDGFYGGQGGYEAGYGHGVPSYGYGYAYTPAAGHKYGPYGSVSQYFPGLYGSSGYSYAPYPGFGGYNPPEVGGGGYYPLGDYVPKSEYGATYPTNPVAYKPSPPAYSAVTDLGKAGASYAPASKGYAQGEGNFFRGYESADQSDAPQSYAYPQENPYTGDAYSQQRIEELQDQIYKLQSVIGNLNRPEYIQKPEDQQVIYDLDSKIGHLRGIVSNLAHPPAYGYESGNADGYDASPKSSKGRTKRDLPRAYEEGRKTAMNDFLRKVDDILSVVNYFTNDWHQKHQDNNSIERAGEVSEQVRAPREVEEESPMARILNKLYSLAEFVDSLGEKVSQLNQNCTASGGCESKAARRKREAKDSGEDDDIIGALGLALQGMAADESSGEDNSVKKEVHPQILQSKLNDLKKQT
ncbi:hypothetical protein PPYR_13565 [Photinus pyralis]|uniref:Uncharacterized protein n=1 Tax=Photinus pyralis TaxID=7054 RepID=A0A5N4A9E8_PHOPY|nr:hypothetical protein PPYR_13565 [Photinus pyralis]